MGYKLFELFLRRANITEFHMPHFMAQFVIQRLSERGVAVFERLLFYGGIYLGSILFYVGPGERCRGSHIECVYLIILFHRILSSTQGFDCVDFDYFALYLHSSISYERRDR